MNASCREGASNPGRNLPGGTRPSGEMPPRTAVDMAGIETVNGLGVPASLQSNSVSSEASIRLRLGFQTRERHGEEPASRKPILYKKRIYIPLSHASLPYLFSRFLCRLQLFRLMPGVFERR